MVLSSDDGRASLGATMSSGSPLPGRGRAGPHGDSAQCAEEPAHRSPQRPCRLAFAPTADGVPSLAPWPAHALFPVFDGSGPHGCEGQLSVGSICISLTIHHVECPGCTAVAGETFPREISGRISVCPQGCESCEGRSPPESGSPLDTWLALTSVLPSASEAAYRSQFAAETAPRSDVAS